jgi:hypothetical protein
MQIFIIGKSTAETDSGIVWEVMGAFSNEADAVAACRPGEWIGPLTVGERLMDEPHEWAGAYYPHPPLPFSEVG